MLACESYLAAMLAGMREKSKQKLVVIGGGTGSFALLSGLKHYFGDITSLVNMVDDGGSTGVLRDELGVLPPGDVRQCLVALSDAPETMRALFNYRFPEGTFAGHSFGNLFLSAMERMTDDFDEAVAMASDVLKISGRVLPITTDNCRLYMKIGERVVAGESAVAEAVIDDPMQRPTLWIEPPARLSESAREAIASADMIVIAPGNLYCALVPSLLVDGVSEALQHSSAQVVYVANLVNKPQHTSGFSVVDYVDELERYIGAPRIDMVLYNIDEPSPELLERYALDGEYPVIVDKTSLKKQHYQAIGGAFMKKDDIIVDEGENNGDHKQDVRLKRSYIRHDGTAIAKQLRNLTISQ